MTPAAAASLGSLENGIQRDVFPEWWRHDPKPIRDYLEMATAEGLTPTTIDHSRRGLIYYSRFLAAECGTDLSRAGWEEFAAYRRYLLAKGLARSAVKNYLGSVVRYYLLLARQRGDSDGLEQYSRTKVIEGNVGRGAPSRAFEPFSSATLKRIVDAAGSYHQIQRCNRWIDSEDYAFIMTLLYTGGRAQFYGLRVDEVDFDRGEIRVRVKGGVPLVIPLHPELAEVLTEHLEKRRYTSFFLFRNGKDPTTLRGRDANQANAWTVCKRVQKAAGLTESVHPHRFRKTLATMGRSLGMDLQHVQAILGHRSVLQTMSIYVRPDIEEVKRDFAQLDLVHASRRDRKASQTQVVAALRRLAPRGREVAWGMIVDGFVEVLTGKRPREDEYARQSFDRYKLSNMMRRRPM